jgi:SAM-dependent methyltransferase
VAELDWGVGGYERVAETIAVASERVVDLAAPAPGERLLDVACGTGNAALLAAGRGAMVTGLDGSARLLEVAASRAQEAGVRAEWVHGDLEALPFADGAFDVAVSVFGVIFARDPAQAAAELERVVRPGGRVLLATWVARGPLMEIMRASMAATARLAPPGPPPPARPDWGDPAALEALFSGPVSVEEHAMPFAADTPEDYVREQGEHHPAWISTRAALGPEAYAALEEEMAAILAAANENPSALRVTSPYLVARIDR